MEKNQDAKLNTVSPYIIPFIKAEFIDKYPFLKKDLICLFLETGRGREREITIGGLIHVSTTTRNQTRSPGMCPYGKSNW